MVSMNSLAIPHPIPMKVSNFWAGRLAAAGAAGIMIEDQTWPKRKADR